VVIRKYQIQALLIVAAFSGFPLAAALSSLLGVPSTPLSVFARGVVVGLSVYVLLDCLRHDGMKSQQGRLFLMAAFWAPYIYRLINDTLLEHVSLSRAPYEYWVWAVGACLMPSVGLMTVNNQQALINAFSAVFVVTLFCSLVTIMYGTGATYDSTTGLYTEVGRLSVDSLNPISAGHIGVTLILVSLWILANRLGFKSRKVVLVAIISCIAGGYLMIASGSRGPILAFAGALFFYLFTLRLQRLARLFLIFLPVFGFIAIGALLVEENMQLTLLDRLVETPESEVAAKAGRLYAFGGAIKQFVENPIFGDSLEEKSTGFYPHNIVLEGLMATGIVGGLPLIVIVLLGMRTSFFVLKGRAFHGWVALLYIQYLLASLTSGAIYNSTEFWALTGLIFSFKSFGTKERGSTPFRVEKAASRPKGALRNYR